MVSVRFPRTLGTIPVLIAVCLLSSPVYAKYSGGTGEPNDPYQIATAADLIALGETPEDYDKHFILTADIDLDPNLPGRKVFDKAVIAPDANDANGWFDGTPFTGVLNGNGRTISHPTVQAKDFVGLFGQLDFGGEVKNLGVMDVNMTGSGHSVGGLVGYNCGGTLANCCCTGMVGGTGSDVGGLVGYDYWGSVTECRSTGTVSGESSVGGLIGHMSGYAIGAAGHVTQSYSAASVHGKAEVGGLVGHNRWGAVTQCYSIGRVSGEYLVGGLVGSTDEGTVTASLWDTQTSGQTTSAGGTGKTTVEMRTAQMFLDAGWDFVGETANGTEDIWKIAEGLDYPRLWWEKYSGGTGEPNDPYQIATAADLIALGETPEDYDKHFILTADIDLDPNLPGRRVFDKAVIAPARITPGGVYGIPFKGVFDGNGHTISHLTMEGAFYLGLFGQLESGAEVRSLGVVEVDITGSRSHVGAVAGSGGRIVNCYTSGSISGKSRVGGLVGAGNATRCHSTAAVSGADLVGGLVGLSTGPVIWCYSTGTVNGGLQVGGLVGLSSGPVVWCYSAGMVNGGSEVGGLVGWNEYGQYVTQCHSTGAVSGTGWSIGGLVGDNRGSLSQCYSTGAVTGTGQSVGGLLGHTYGEREDVTACFWDTQTSGQAASAAGTGKTTAEMQTAKTFLDAGWDFVGETDNGTEDIWKIAEGLDYPRLWWEPYDGRVTVVLGQVFTVTLESNPSTGYRWEWVDHQDSIVEQMGEAQFKPREAGDPPLVGAGGWESFDFKAVNPGQMTLKLVYRRPWEEGVEPLKTFSLQVTVP